MRTKSMICFAIVRYNRLTYQSGGVMAIIRGRGKAETEVAQFESEQSIEDRFGGWGFFLEPTDFHPGMDLERATSLRQTRQDVIETKAQELATKAQELAVLNRQGRRYPAKSTPTAD
jgi:hypothetical protein